MALNSLQKKIKYVRMLALPKVFWSGWKNLPKILLWDLRLEIKRTLRAKTDPRNHSGARSKFLA